MSNDTTTLTGVTRTRIGTVVCDSGTFAISRSWSSLRQNLTAQHTLEETDTIALVELPNHPCDGETCDGSCTQHIIPVLELRHEDTVVGVEFVFSAPELHAHAHRALAEVGVNPSDPKHASVYDSIVATMWANIAEWEPTGECVFDSIAGGEHLCVGDPYFTKPGFEAAHHQPLQLQYRFADSELTRLAVLYTQP
jgi:hypothetical protein